MRTIFTLLVLAACMLASCSRSPETVVFDFTTGFTVANAHWPAGTKDTYFERYGSFHFVVRMTDGLSVDIPNGKDRRKMNTRLVIAAASFAVLGTIVGGCGHLSQPGATHESATGAVVSPPRDTLVFPFTWHRGEIAVAV